jgi:hypothetical protein
MQALLVKRDQMIQAFAANGADRPFDISAATETDVPIGLF